MALVVMFVHIVDEVEHPIATIDNINIYGFI